MNYKGFYQQINLLSAYEGSQVCKHLSDVHLEQLYCEVVNHKKKFKRAYEHLLNELNRRKDIQINGELEEIIIG